MSVEDKKNIMIVGTLGALIGAAIIYNQLSPSNSSSTLSTDRFQQPSINGAPTSRPRVHEVDDVVLISDDAYPLKADAEQPRESARRDAAYA